MGGWGCGVMGGGVGGCRSRMACLLAAAAWQCPAAPQQPSAAAYPAAHAATALTYAVATPTG